MHANVRRNRKAGRRGKLPEHEISGGNVFADIGMPEPYLEQAKATIAAAIGARIDSLRLNQTAAARRMGIDQPRVSKVKSGRLEEFALGTLFELALKLGIDFNIDLAEEQNPEATGALHIRGGLLAV